MLLKKVKSLGLGTITAVLVTSFLAGLAGSYAKDQFVANNSTSQAVTKEYVSNESELVSSIAQEVSPSVVSINVVSSSSSFYGPIESTGAGTGVIISKDGLVLTNRHVVPEGSDEIEVILSDGTVYDDVTVIGRDPRSGVDIAFLKINDVDNLSPAILGDSDQLKVGDKVIAIGNALGEFQTTVTTGIISGRSRPVYASGASGTEYLSNLLQTDAAINPGNSGGPLVDINGQVVGINTAVADAENIGFAIAISDIRGVIDEVLKSGKVVVPYIGVRYETIDKAYAKEYNLDVTEGAYIRGRGALSAVIANSPADKAGLQEHDIIVKVNDTALDSKNGLGALVGRNSVGDTISLTILRDGQTQNVDVTLEEASEDL